MFTATTTNGGHRLYAQRDMSAEHVLLYAQDVYGSMEAGRTISQVWEFKPAEAVYLLRSLQAALGLPAITEAQAHKALKKPTRKQAKP